MGRGLIALMGAVRCLAAAAGVALLGLALSPRAAPPAVKIEYAPRQDLLCSLLPGGGIKDEWKAEMLARQAELVKIWNGEGARLIAAAEAISGRAFPPQGITARLTLCTSASESFPLADRVTINMRYALASFTSNPVSMRYKAHTLFHELLHILLFRDPVQGSVLLQKHAGEHERVRGHLHLLALQKAVLLKLDAVDALREVVAVDSALPGGHYKRAWELVNATEGEYLRYVAELSR